jgi:hypothetical protein
VIKQFIKKLIQYYIDLIVSWYRKIKTYFNLNYEIKKYHASFDEPEKPIIKEVGKLHPEMRDIKPDDELLVFKVVEKEED